MQWLRLSLLRGIGPVQGRRVVQAVGDIEALWSTASGTLPEISGIGEKLLLALQRCRGDAAGAVAAYCRRHDIGVLCPDDAGWPDSLLALDDAPLVLFIRGDAGPLRHERLLAVVGARRASREGRLLARRWCRFSDRGVAIASGMAYGIDAAAHAGTLEGVADRCRAGLGSWLPERTAAAAGGAHHAAGVRHQRIPARDAPRPEFFPRRNRVIAGLAGATLVIEADLRSGSLITARLAADYGRDVLAVPGSVLTGNHDGCHQLIRDGAALAARAEDVMEHMDWTGHDRRGRSYRPSTPEEEKLLQALGRESMHVDMLAESCGLTMSRLSPSCSAWSWRVVERLPGSRYLLAVELRNT